MPDHMPKLSKSGKNWIFEEPCLFTGNSLNVAKCKTIECSNPLANYPVLCLECNTNVWRFDMHSHYQREHGTNCPDVGTISDPEKGILNKKKKNTKNALTLRDLESLTDEEIQLLPLKDFWNSATKEWKKSNAGNLGRQQTNRIKIIFGQNKFEYT